MSDGISRAVHGLYYSFHNPMQNCGHRALFSSQPGRGWMIHFYHDQAPGWAHHRVWNFILFAVHHIEDGKATDPAGWHIVFASLRLVRKRGEIALRWRKADTFSTKRPRP